MPAVEFDAAKDLLNRAKHGVSLARAQELEVVSRVTDQRFAEPRFRAYGFLDGRVYCLAYTLRGDHIRAISLRRVHRKEYRRHLA